MSPWSRTVGVAMTAILGAFGQSVQYRPGGSVDAEVEIRGVFDEAHEFVDVGTGVDLSTTAPALTVRAADLPAAPAGGDSVTIEDRKWLVTDVQPDGGGNMLLKLQRDHAP